MVDNCCAPGCTNRRGKKKGVSYYRIPKDAERREKWIGAIKRARSLQKKTERWDPPAVGFRLCSDHFISGRKSDNPLSPDFIPSIFDYLPSPEKRRHKTRLEVFNRRQKAKLHKVEQAKISAEAIRQSEWRMSSPGQSRGTSADLFEDLWKQLRECHQNAFQELETKVSKLKKERYLDAQRLEVFHSRTQQLKEQNKTLQDAIILLEEKLHAGGCDRCASLEEDMKNNQDQNIRLLGKLKNENKSLEDDKRKLRAELQKLKVSCSAPEQITSPEQEEGIIPDSPILPSTLPVTNKLKKRKCIDKMKHVRYAERPLPQANNSLFSALDKEHVDATKNPGRAQVLVPNTCELDTTEISNDVNLNLEDAIAETCGLELINKPYRKKETTAGQKSSSKSPLKYAIHSNPDSTSERSPSLLPRVKRFSGEGSVNKAKRKKEERFLQQEDKQVNQEGADTQNGGKRTSTPLRNQSFKQGLHDGKSAQSGSSNHKPSVSCLSPAFKKPNVKGEENKNSVGRNGKAQQDPNASHNQHGGEDGKRRIKVEPMWSMDPALVPSMYDSEWRGDEPKEEEEECPADTDRTWVSHSLLQRRGENVQDSKNSVSGPGEKANDSLVMMFDTTACGEYNSHLDQSQPCGGDDEEEDDDPHETTMSQISRRRARGPAFAHLAVVRKKDERRKLKGTTCKECDIYYAHLPGEEKEKKLSACSRHRFLYIPPCTPENFWEVGFPSTQTCIDRGYINEEKNPQARTRRRQPYNALFSPLKLNQEES
ncbi:DNA endonuclease RBBP8 isoform X2 [Eleginops maclovinus]|uniref:DNA endonuclease RBBP8 isoform X2 n=1 Tax=Eleginops maclovinus TaxID=56733 RepID=UPI00308033DA